MKPIFTIIFTVLTLNLLFAQTQQDTIYTYYAKTPVVIDGNDLDACWGKAAWHPIEQVWLGNAMAEGDFVGKFKTAWDKDYLYVLVEVVDDSLSDDHSSPLDNYWNDDCVEIFIDEDRSGGNHQYNNSAFAYHCSTFYDVIDGAGTNGTTINCRNNITMRMDTIGDHMYRWEFAVKMFDKSFVYSNPDPSRVYLSPNKLMGFSIAYCDNDETRERENFIGSVVMPKGHENDSYINSDYFGTMLLVDPTNEYTSQKDYRLNEKKVKVYPNPATDKVSLTNIPDDVNLQVEIFSISGAIIQSEQLSTFAQTIDISNLDRGVYYMNLSSGTFYQTEKIVKR
ncbi:MAG TPA: sugar-binding protein [Prolixibacteraceae bacterium]|nr:sugar-binding protein [Prolixibacteraceae bacterium]